jgi:hypothetical protein
MSTTGVIRPRWGWWAATRESPCDRRRPAVRGSSGTPVSALTARRAP